MPEQPLNSMQTLQTTETKTRQRLEMKERPALSGLEIPDVAGRIIDKLLLLLFIVSHLFFLPCAFGL